MKKISLTLVLSCLFVISILGQFIFGFNAYNEERRENGAPQIASHVDYLKTGHFISSVAENMESEFLQMGLFVFLTIFLYQIGSSESKKLHFQQTKEDLEKEQHEKVYCQTKRKQHGWIWYLYENSLTLALIFIFAAFFLLHAYGSFLLLNEQKAMHHQQLIEFSQIFSESEFWFESFQNWQSEFFSIATLGLLSIFLRQYKSAQSKKMFDPRWKTGAD